MMTITQSPAATGFQCAPQPEATRASSLAQHDFSGLDNNCYLIARLEPKAFR